MKESPIFLKTYDFLAWLLRTTIKFPKSQRFVMAKRVEEAGLNFYDLLIRAVKGKKKREILEQADYELERLRMYLRLCKDLEILKINQYKYTSERLVEIGNLLGTWLKKVRVLRG